MTKDFKFEFYRLVIPSNAGKSFEKIIEQVIDISIADRILSVFDRPVYLYEVSEEFIDFERPDNKENKIRLIKGMFIRVKTDDLPNWVDKEGVLQALEDDDKKLGLGEKSMFLYNPETRVFIFQSTTSGISLKAIFIYFQELLSLSYTIQSRVCINEDAMSRIDKLKSVSKFDIKIASLDSMEIYSDQNKDDDDINRIRENTRAPFLSLTLSVEHKDSSLDLSFIKDFINRYLPFINSNNGVRTDRMLLNGRTEDEGSFIMNLIEDKMKESVRVDYKNFNGRRVVMDSERYSSLLTAWKRREESILKMYMHPNDSGKI